MSFRINAYVEYMVISIAKSGFVFQSSKKKNKIKKQNFLTSCFIFINAVDFIIIFCHSFSFQNFLTLNFVKRKKSLFNVK